MSLLMDALKRAETAKQEAARAQFGITTPPAPEPALSLEPLPDETSGTAPHPLPDLAHYIDAVDADLASTPLPKAATTPPSTPSAQPITPPSEQANRQTVRNAFAAKQAVAETPSRLPLWLALGTLAIAGISIGGYVWYQLNAMNRGSLAAPQPLATAPATQAVAAPAPPVATAPPSPPAAQIVQPGLFTPRPETPAPTAVPEAPANPVPIRLTRSQPTVDPSLTRGHANLQRGEIELARREFEQTLRRDPNNTDALLALASIAQQQGRGTDAERLRQRALVANPADPATQAAALSGSAAETDPQGTESRMKSLLSAQPESAALNFALGNLYSRQNRWSEAQQVYFNAVAADGDNPDYLFNLAVSLDHLRQGRLAVQHYRLALEAGSKRPAAFDRNKVEKRIGELQAEPQR